MMEGSIIPLNVAGMIMTVVCKWMKRQNLFDSLPLIEVSTHPPIFV